ncbi:MAG: helix-turn-helix transcriptional regulator [Oscillospiraceae bacterium]|nr:helix-turn-helix transcriptional regulator [Oscillospiraceae bacterium]
MEKQTLGQKIAELRKAKNMTQLELANLLNITDKAVSKWERDISCPDINTFPKLAEILGVSVDELLQASTANKEEPDESRLTIDLVLKAIPLALGIGVTVLTAIDQIYWEDAVSLLGIAVLAIAVRNFREK